MLCVFGLISYAVHFRWIYNGKYEHALVSSPSSLMFDQQNEHHYTRAEEKGNVNVFFFLQLITRKLFYFRSV